MNCDIDALDARSHTKDSYSEAYTIKQALLNPSVPTRSISGLWVDANGKPMIGYFGDSDVQENAHSIPVSDILSFILFCLY